MPLALRTERTEARLLPDQKKRIEQAARIKGLSVSDFIVQHADEAAIRTIEMHTTWTLQNRDRDLFLRVLRNAPKPSARMNRAVRRYRRIKGE